MHFVVHFLNADSIDNKRLLLLKYLLQQKEEENSYSQYLSLEECSTVLVLTTYQSWVLSFANFWYLFFKNIFICYCHLPETRVRTFVPSFSSIFMVILSSCQHKFSINQFNNRFVGVKCKFSVKNV